MDRDTAARVVVQDVGAGWVAEMEWREGVLHGGPDVLVIRPADETDPPHGGLSQTVLRRLDLKAATDTLRRQLAHLDTLSGSHDRDDRIKQALSHGVTDEYLALLSSRYVGIVNHGQAGPLDALAEITGKTASTVKGHLWQARKRGLLEGSAGRAGGKLTAKASRVLADIVPNAPAELTDPYG